MKIANICLASVALCASPAFALLCPGNFNEIHLGDTVEQVKSACGAPLTEKTSDSDASAPQEWNYYVSANSAFYQNVSQGTQATLKTTIAFANDKVTNMSVNGVGVSSTAICGNNIQIGDSSDTVKAACGKPEFINRGTGSQKGTADDQKPKEETVLTYQVNEVTTTLTFVDGKFTQRKD